MKTVLIVVGKLYIGGAERVCRNIGFYADPARFQIDYLVFGDEIGAYEPELLEKGCRIWHVPSPSESYRCFYSRLKSLIRENGYDVIHCHTMFNSGLVLRAAHACGVPVRIAHSHSIHGNETRTLMQNCYENLMRRWILRYATHRIGCGQAAGEWLFGKKAFHESGVVLLNGIDLKQFCFDPAVRDRIRQENHWEGMCLIGHAGHLEPVKNQIFLLRLMPELLKKQPNVRLVLLGDGRERNMLEQTISDLKLEKKVSMLGNVPNVNEYLSAMDVFAFPSLYEGMPLAILEAQANGLPCVLSDRVPKDVFQTDLLHPVSLEAGSDAWIEEILAVQRSAPEKYYNVLQNKGFGTQEMLDKLYRIYQGSAI